MGYRKKIKRKIRETREKVKRKMAEKRMKILEDFRKYLEVYFVEGSEEASERYRK